MSDLGDLGFAVEDLAAVLGAPVSTKVEVMQGIVYGLEAGTLSLLLRGQNLLDADVFPVGGIRFLRSYTPHVGDSVWVLKNGADYFVLGTLQPAAQASDTVFIGVDDGPPFLNNFSNFGSGFQPAQYYVDSDGWVNFSGMIKRSSALSTTFGVVTNMWTLPSELWPAENKRFTVIVDNGAFTTKSWILEVRTDGTFGMFGHTSMGNPDVWTSLENVRWMSSAVAVKRQHEWVPFLYSGAWDWDKAALPYTPPGEWIRWDGLVRLRGRINAGTTRTMVSLTPEAGRRRYQKMFRAVTGGLTPAGQRIDFEAYRRTLTQPAGTVLSEDVPLDSMQWLTALPDEAWTNIELRNSWTQHANTYDWPTAAYFIDGYGVLHMRGLLAGGTTALGTVVAWLPPGALPVSGRRFPSQHATGATPASGSVDLDPATGLLTISHNATGNSYLSLEEISYVVDMSQAA